MTPDGSEEPQDEGPPKQASTGLTDPSQSGFAARESSQSAHVGSGRARSGGDTEGEGEGRAGARGDQGEGHEPRTTRPEDAAEDEYNGRGDDVIEDNDAEDGEPVSEEDEVVDARVGGSRADAEGGGGHGYLGSGGEEHDGDGGRGGPRRTGGGKGAASASDDPLADFAPGVNSGDPVGADFFAGGSTSDEDHRAHPGSAGGSLALDGAAYDPLEGGASQGAPDSGPGDVDGVARGEGDEGDDGYYHPDGAAYGGAPSSPRFIAAMSSATVERGASFDPSSRGWHEQAVPRGGDEVSRVPAGLSQAARDAVAAALANAEGRGASGAATAEPWSGRKSDESKARKKKKGHKERRRKSSRGGGDDADDGEGDDGEAAERRSRRHDQRQHRRAPA